MARRHPAAPDHHLRPRRHGAGVQPAGRDRSRAGVPRMTNANFLNAAEIAHKVTHGTLAATDVIETALDRLARHDPVLNSFTAITADRARARARAIDAARRAGQGVGPLAGVAVAVKNRSE